MIRKDRFSLTSSVAVDAIAPAQWPAAISRLLQEWMPPEGRARCTLASQDLAVPASDRAKVAHAVAQRQAEFIAGRWCAYQALEELGVAAQGLLEGMLGAPAWPEGITGSITHESGICAAAVVRSSSERGIGIDLFDRRHKSDMQEIAYLVLAPEEMALVATCEDVAASIQLAFCLKEAVVKAISPNMARYLDMREIRLSIDAGAFEAAVAGCDGRLTGKWCEVGPFFLAFAVLAA